MIHRTTQSIAFAVCLSLLLAGCGRPLVAGNKIYPTYGFINKDGSKSKNVCYEISFGNIVWSIILIETIIAPVYFFGFSLFNPVRLKNGPDDQCGIDGAEFSSLGIAVEEKPGLSTPQLKQRGSQT